jgi:hypothetical protein
MMNPKLSKSKRMSYSIGRGETGVLTYEPYKSLLLPLWRFKTPEIARTSSQALHATFLEFYKEGDFIGMDMSRKFIQMGMTRAKRYANYKGGRKYVEGKQIEKTTGATAAQEEKEESSLVFREVWEKCKAHDGYGRLKKQFQAEKKEWARLKRDDEVEKAI